MYLSDFVFFSVTLSLLALMAIMSAWDHIGHYTDWEQKVHVITSGRLHQPVKLAGVTPTLRATNPEVLVECDCRDWATWNNEGIETPACCRNDTVSALKSLVSVLDDSNIKYSLEGGTLLGAVRCGEFIQYDYDVDINVESPEPFLVKAALDKWHRHDTDNIFDRMTVHLTGLPWPQTEIEGSYQSHVMVDIHIVDRLSKTRPCLFEGVMMRCAGDYRTLLTEKYGKDWMIPHRWTNSRKEGLDEAIDMKQLNHCVEKRETMHHLCEEFPDVIVGEKDCTPKKSLDDKQEYDCSSIIPNGEGVMTRTKPPFKMFIHPVEQDIHVSGMIKRSGVWEHDQINLFTHYLKEYHSALFVDVGLNIGMYGLVAAANGHKVIAFEPLLLNLDRVCSTINWNKWNNLITIYPYAITNTATKVSFSTPRENAGGTSVRDNKSLDGVENVDFANAYTFDSFNIDYNGPILMKIDIEGHECQMFEKINKFFANNDVKLIMIEWGQLVNKCGNKIADILLGHGLLPYDAAGKTRYSLKLKPWSRGVWDMIWK